MVYYVALPFIHVEDGLAPGVDIRLLAHGRLGRNRMADSVHSRIFAERQRAPLPCECRAIRT